jgi:hypothetical protein
MVNKKTVKKPTKLSGEEQAEKELEQYWAEVDQLAQQKIYDLLTCNLPLPGLKLITHSYDFTDKHQSLTGLFLHKDVDYRTLLIELENEWYERTEEEGEKLPDKEILAEEVALWYCQIVMKALITDLSDYSRYDPYFFENLTDSNY